MKRLPCDPDKNETLAKAYFYVVFAQTLLIVRFEFLSIFMLVDMPQI